MQQLGQRDRVVFANVVLIPLQGRYNLGDLEEKVVAELQRRKSEVEQLQRRAEQKQRRESKHPQACHNFFGYLTENADLARLSSLSGQPDAFSPYIMVEHMLPRWKANNRQAQAIEPAFTLTSLTALLRARSKDFAPSAPGDLKTKRVKELGLNCVQKPFFSILRDGAFAQLLQDICQDWPGICKDASGVRETESVSPSVTVGQACKNIVPASPTISSSDKSDQFGDHSDFPQAFSLQADSAIPEHPEDGNNGDESLGARMQDQGGQQYAGQVKSCSMSWHQPREDESMQRSQHTSLMRPPSIVGWSNATPPIPAGRDGAQEQQVPVNPQLSTMGEGKLHHEIGSARAAVRKKRIELEDSVELCREINAAIGPLESSLAKAKFKLSGQKCIIRGLNQYTQWKSTLTSPPPACDELLGTSLSTDAPAVLSTLDTKVMEAVRARREELGCHGGTTHDEIVAGRDCASKEHWDCFAQLSCVQASLREAKDVTAKLQDTPPRLGSGGEDLLVLV
ncbi:hypothetical protein WJX84_000096 [Apatococcus fuscideae]|uniref:Uncharacterized protein n=1 Tax=Apatococcus fuscideae TaxID=2026836 RepID=A0AAW1SZB0_9CHLO